MGKMKVREFMSSNPLVVGSNITIAEALDRMKERDVWSPVVREEGEIIGFLTERDILTGIIAARLTPHQVKVEDVMSRRYGVLRPDETLADAARAMMKVKARLVVLEDGQLLGVVTAADIVRAYAGTATVSPPLRPYATWEVLKVHYQASVREAVRIMKVERVGSLLVEEERKIKGIFTERDAVKRFLVGGGDPCDPVGKYSTLDLITLDANATLVEAAKLMANAKIKRLPLTSEGEIKGIITARDVVEAIWRMTTEEELAP